VALLCSIFLGLAILDFVHMLSYDSMPALFIPAKDGQSISFFLAARRMAAGAVLAIAFQPWNRSGGKRTRVSIDVWKRPDACLMASISDRACVPMSPIWQVFSCDILTMTGGALTRP
jgi:hypothetical protein